MAYALNMVWGALRGSIKRPIRKLPRDANMTHLKFTLLTSSPILHSILNNTTVIQYALFRVKISFSLLTRHALFPLKLSFDYVEKTAILGRFLFPARAGNRPGVTFLLWDIVSLEISTNNRRLVLTRDPHAYLLSQFPR